MINLAMLFWIGYALSAPALYWWGWSMLAIYKIGELLIKIYKLGKGEKDDE